MAEEPVAAVLGLGRGEQVLLVVAGDVYVLDGQAGAVEGEDGRLVAADFGVAQGDVTAGEHQAFAHVLVGLLVVGAADQLGALEVDGDAVTLDEDGAVVAGVGDAVNAGLDPVLAVSVWPSRVRADVGGSGMVPAAVIRESSGRTVRRFRKSPDYAGLVQLRRVEIAWPAQRFGSYRLAQHLAQLFRRQGNRVGLHATRCLGFLNQRGDVGGGYAVGSQGRDGQIAAKLADTVDGLVRVSIWRVHENARRWSDSDPGPGCPAGVGGGLGCWRPSRAAAGRRRRRRAARGTSRRWVQRSRVPRPGRRWPGPARRRGWRAPCPRGRRRRGRRGRLAAGPGPPLGMPSRQRASVIGIGAACRRRPR